MMPKKLYPNPTNLKNLAPAFSHRNLLKTYTITLCSCGAQFILYTYLQKLLIDISGFKEQNTTYILLLYGICAIFGNLWGGKMVDKKGAIFSLRLILSIQIFVFLNFLWTIYIPILIIFNIALMGFFSFSTIPALKMLSIAKAKRHTYKIMDSTISVNEAAFNVGIALASFIGGLVLTNIGIEFNALFASIFILPALIFSLIFSKDKINYKHFKRKVE